MITGLDSMYWQENSKKDIKPTDEIQDLVFKIQCSSLPVDHAYALSEAITPLLPWLKTATGAGIHQVYVAESGNGWMRPENPDELLYLSRRTKLVLRVPDKNLDSALQLEGKQLDIAGNKMIVGTVEKRPLSVLTTLFTRYLVFSDEQENEVDFLENTMKALRDISVLPEKMLPGREKTIQMPGKMIKTRSLMITGISVEESIRIQQHGLGLYQDLGCGIFLPHKDILEVGSMPE